MSDAPGGGTPPGDAKNSRMDDEHGQAAEQQQAEPILVQPIWHALSLAAIFGCIVLVVSARVEEWPQVTLALILACALVFIVGEAWSVSLERRKSTVRQRSRARGYTIAVGLLVGVAAALTAHPPLVPGLSTRELVTKAIAPDREIYKDRTQELRDDADASTGLKHDALRLAAALSSFADSRFSAVISESQAMPGPNQWKSVDAYAGRHDDETVAMYNAKYRNSVRAMRLRLKARGLTSPLLDAGAAGIINDDNVRETAQAIADLAYRIPAGSK